MSIRDRGSVTTEILLLTPVVMLLGLFALQVGRWSGAQLDVQHAADSAARAASMVASGRMASEARLTALADLTNRGAQCEWPIVTAERVQSDGMRAVRVVVSCTVNQQGLMNLGMGRRRVRAGSMEYIDVFTYR